MKFPLRFWFLMYLGFWFGSAHVALAHPMGNFSINHFARFQTRPGLLALRTVLDFAEIPTSERMPQLDANGDQTISESEKRAFLRSEIASNASGYVVQIGGKKAALKLRASSLGLRPGAGGLQTLRIVADWTIALPAAPSNRVAFRDLNFEGRNGWMEIVALGGAGQKIVDSDAASVERSRELTQFPASDISVAPRQSEANFTVVKTGAGGRDSAHSNSTEPQFSSIASQGAGPNNTQTPQNRFTQSIAEKELTPGLVLTGLLAALAFGAVHALSPGHGKTMVAAYLVGSRGTSRHAVTLGLVVTITHTLGVFALGMMLLFASTRVQLERLFPLLSAASGLLIFGVGLWLFMSRYQDLTRPPSQPHSHDHGDGDHDHSHDGHSHGDGMHSHGGRAHSHAVPEGPITLKTLVALGISGGIVPCPEALVVLLAAVKLHRVGYGMLLITAFSVGLAAALISIGLFVVAARARFGDRIGGRSGILTRYLPLGSAAVITVIGMILTLQATGISGR